MHAQPDPPVRTERRELERGVGALARARAYTRQFLQEGSDLSAAALQDVLVVVSELVSNAIRHAPGPCTLALTDCSDRLTIAVSDTSTTPPQPRTGDLESGGGGFGWHLLRQLSEDVQVLIDPPHGKTVTATMALRPPEPRPDELAPPSAFSPP